jgi:hypothetical protein
MAVLASCPLVGERYPKLAGWAYLFSVPFWVWQLWAGWPGNPTDEELQRQYSPAIPALLLWIPCFFLLYWQRAHTWAVVCIALLCALVVALVVKYSYRLSAVAAFAGWSLTIPVVFTIHWPNGQRFWLVLVLGGLTTTVHGALRFAKALLGVRHHVMSESHV